MANQNISGFIIDTPKSLIETSKGDLHMVTSSSGEVSFGGDSLEISGGFSFYSLAEIDKKKTLEIKLTDTQFDLMSMALSSGGTLSTGATSFKWFGDPFVIDGTGKFIINKVVEPNSIRINGYTEVTTAPVAGQFKVTIAATTTVQFVVGDAGNTVYPSYTTAVASTQILSVGTTDFPGAGQVTLTFPIYSGADSVDSVVEGYGQLVIFKAKILQSNKIGGSYKTASTFDITLKGLDPRRPDGKMWEWKYLDI